MPVATMTTRTPLNKSIKQQNNSCARTDLELNTGITLFDTEQIETIAEFKDKI